MTSALPAPAVPTEPTAAAPDLPPRGRPARRRRPGRKVAWVLGIVVVGAVGATLAVTWGRGRSSGGRLGGGGAELPLHQVARAKLVVTVAERGELESARNLDVASEVEGQTVIISILPQGTKVRKGDLVAELDSAALRDSLASQEIATKKAEADYLNAAKTRAVTEIAVAEYRDGTYPNEMKTARGELEMATSNLAQAVDRFDWSRRMLAKSLITPAQHVANKQSLLNCQIAHQNIRTKIHVLEHYTRRKTITELQAEVDKARSDELAKQAVYQLELSKQRKLERQIARCKLYAPADGLIVYANDPNQRPGSNQAQIEEGATVRERQKIFRLPDITRMRVSTQVHESLVDRVAPGQRARIRVEGLGGATLSGTVESIRPLARPGNTPGSEVKVYTTLVAIDEPPPGVRPGMEAKVEILISEVDDVVAVPVEAVLQFQGKDHVYVATPDGPRRRAVALGTTDDKLVEVKRGVREGERVVLDPLALMSEAEKVTAFTLGGSDGSGDAWGGALAGSAQGPRAEGPGGEATGGG